MPHFLSLRMDDCQVLLDPHNLVQQQHSRQQQGNGDGSQRPGQTANHSADSFNDDLPAANTVEVQHRERLVDYYA